LGKSMRYVLLALMCFACGNSLRAEAPRIGSNAVMAKLKWVHPDGDRRTIPSVNSSCGEPRCGSTSR